MRPYAVLRILTAATVIAFGAGDARELSAEPRFGVGCLLQTTPFFQRLDAAGVFDIPVIHMNNPRPMPLLFRMASSFHYEHDDRNDDVWQSADQTARFFRGDCEDKAIWLYTQMRRNGYNDVALHIGRYAPSSRRFHMWVTYVEEDGRTMLLDPTIQKKPWNVDAFPEKLYRSLHILNGTDCISL